MRWESKILKIWSEQSNLEKRNFKVMDREKF